MIKTNAKIVFVINRRIFNGKLTRLFTGCYCYHVGILIDDKFYDVSPFTGRRVKKYEPIHYKHDQHVIFDAPVDIIEYFLIDQIDNYNVHYGFLDYVLYLIKPLKRIFPTMKLFNPHGLICSEQVNNDMIDSKWTSPWHKDEHPPSPCEMLKYFSNRYTHK